MKVNNETTEHTLFISPTPAKSLSDTYMETLWRHTLSVCNVGRKKMLVTPFQITLCKLYLAECSKRNKRFLPGHVLKKSFRAEGMKVSKKTVIDSGVNSDGLMYAFLNVIHAFRTESNKSQSTAHLVSKMATTFNINIEALTS